MFVTFELSNNYVHLSITDCENGPGQFKFPKPEGVQSLCSVHPFFVIGVRANFTKFFALDSLQQHLIASITGGKRSSNILKMP